jgi:hypothetical protein
VACDDVHCARDSIGMCGIVVLAFFAADATCEAFSETAEPYPQKGKTDEDGDEDYCSSRLAGKERAGIPCCGGGI